MNSFNILDLKDKDLLNDIVLLVKTKKMGLGKNGKPFISMHLGNQQGFIDSRLWDQVEESEAQFEAGDLVTVKGRVQVYNNRKQLVVHKIALYTGADHKPEDFIVKSSRPNLTETFATLNIIVQKIENDYIKQLCLDVIHDESIKLKLLEAPAARSMHHAYRGGLLIHTVSMLEILVFLASHYSFLNKDLLIFGGIFHDLGKIEELSINDMNQISYTDNGQMLGHMLISCEIIEKKTSRILGFPEELKTLLKHMVLSHHGKIEYGSPKVPQFTEAMLVAMVDEMDSKVEQVFKFILEQRQSGEKWSLYNEHFDRYFLLDDLKEKWK